MKYIKRAQIPDTLERYLDIGRNEHSFYTIYISNPDASDLFLTIKYLLKFDLFDKYPENIVNNTS